MNELVQINRRIFLLGAGAVALTVAVPMTAQSQLVNLPSPHTYLRRHIHDMTVGFELPIDPEGRALLASDGAAFISVRRISGTADLHSMGINIRGNYRWVAWDPVEYMASTPDSPIYVAVDYSRPELSRITCTIDLSCKDKVDDGPDVELIESWRIVDDVYDPPAVMFLHPDNSLEARWRRERGEPEPVTLNFGRRLVRWLRP